MKLAILIITLITGESGPIHMDENLCLLIEREFYIAKALGHPPQVELSDGRTVPTASMTCITETETAERPTS